MTHALGIDLGPLPERELDPPDPGTADRIHEEAEAEILREAKDLNWWIALFDEVEVEGVDLVRIANAMHDVHCGNYNDATDRLIEAAISTVQSMARAEAQERLDEMEEGP